MVRKPGFVGGISPMNTLTGSADTQHRRTATLASSPIRQTSSSNRARNPEKESHAEYTTAQFGPPLPTNDALTRTPHRGRKRSLESITMISDGSQSQRTGRSAVRNGTNSNVGELRGLPGYQKTPRARKRHRKYNDTEVLDLESIISESPIENEVLNVDSQEAYETNPIPLDDLGQRFSTKVSPPPKRVLSTSLAKESSPSKRGRVGCSPDHLAPTDEEMRKRRAHALSASVSTRGDIARSTFISKTEKPSKASNKGTSRAVQASPTEAAREVTRDGLRVRRAVSGPSRYDGTDQNEGAILTLVMREMSHILHPECSNMDVPKPLDWCTINLTKVQRVELPRKGTDSTLAYIQRSSDLATFAAASMMIEFESTRDLHVFQDWCEIFNKHSSQAIRTLRVPKLEDKFTNQWKNAAQSQNTKEKMNSSSSGRSALVERRDLMEHKHKSRSDEIPLTAKRVADQTIDLVEGGNTKAKKLKDSMSTSTNSPAKLPKGDPHVVPSEQPSLSKRQTRTTRTTFALRETPPPPEFPRWTKEHADWSKDWMKSVVYPPTGKNRAVVDAEDIERLDEGEFLNDNLIIFYLKYLQNKLESDRKGLADRIYFHNTFFYERLKPTKSGAGINYDNVKGWTSKVDLFSKDFIVVPINEFAHWYVAIICNAPKLIERKESGDGDCTELNNDEDHLETTTEVEEIKDEQASSDQVVSDVVMEDSSGLATELSRAKLKSPPTKYDGTESHINGTGFSAAPKRKKAAKRQSTGPRQFDPSSPRIITLDSLATPHSPACGNLRNYLIAEANDKKGIDISDTGKLGMTARDLPLQMNHCDCGLYLLGYIQEFLKSPDDFVRSLMLHEEIKWNLDSSALRNDIRSLLFDLQEEQKQRDQAEAVERKNRKREAHKAKKQQDSDEKITEAAEFLTLEAPLEPAKSPHVEPSPKAAKQPLVPTAGASRLLQSTREVSQGSEASISSAKDAQPEVANLQTSTRQSSAPPMKQEDQALPSREVDEERVRPHYIPPLSDSASEVSPLESKSIVEATDDDDQEQAEMVYKPDSTLSSSRSEVQQPKLKKSSPKHPRDLHFAKQPVKQTGAVSGYFAGRRPGDQKGTARVRQPLAKMQTSVISIGSDSE